MNILLIILKVLIIFILLLFLVIPIITIAILIKLDSTGPIIHWSKRIGLNNKVFLMPKFRTMKVDTKDVATHLLDNPKDKIMYLTLMPCLMCSKAIVNSGIKKVIYKDDYRDTRGIELLKRCSIEVLRLN